MAFEDLALSIVVVALVILIFWTYKLNSKLSAPKELTEKAVEVRTLATTLSQEVSSLRTEVGNIREHATKIATLSEKYGDTEQRVRTIHSILVGSYKQGRTGEQVLKNMMSDLMRAGFVSTNLRLGTQVVEYGVRFSDGKMLAIDSKFVGTEELDFIGREDISEDERGGKIRQLVTKMGKRIDEVASYIDTELTLPFAIMAIPDSAVQFTSELMGDASKRNVIIGGYSSLPPLVAYFLKIQATYALPQDVKLLTQYLQQVQNTLNKFDADYFANRFSRPLSTINNALKEIERSIADIIGLINPERMRTVTGITNSAEDSEIN